MPLSPEQIEAVIQWMNTWEQLKDTAIPMRFKEDFLHKTDNERLCERLRREKIGEELKLISKKMDRKSKQELLQNPLVKEIAQEYAKKNMFNGLLGNNNLSSWDDFVKSNEPVMEWEITQFRHKTGSIEYNLKDGKYVFTGDLGYGLSLDTMLNFGHSVKSGHIEIQKVKRLSDGEIFEVGDNTQVGIITSFEIQGQNMIAKGSDFEWHLNQLEKDKLPLFTTTDGKLVYEGDAFWQIYSGWGMTQPKLYRANNQDKIQYVQTFSTEQAAQEYITLNKPCLSVSDLLKINSMVLIGDECDVLLRYKNLLELAKAKQNKS